MKVFNTTAVCNPEIHYMADTSVTLDKIITDYIDTGLYFTINRARQYGKTTTLYALANKLSDKYYVIQLSFEWADDLFQSKYDLASGFIEMVRHEMEFANFPEALIEKWSRPIHQRTPMSDLNKRITELCKNSDREIILMIDEVDKTSNNDLMILFLGLLRDKYIRRSMKKDFTFKSVILAGVYDIKNLKSKIRPDAEHGFNSPWNVAVDFKVDMSLKPHEICEMLVEYKNDHKLSFDAEWFAQQIYDYTSGYPYLVSKICWLLDNDVCKAPEYGTKDLAWTDVGFQRAIKLLLKENNALYEDLDKKLDDNAALKEFIYKIVVCRERIGFNQRTNLIKLGTMFGWLKDSDGWAVISNRIFETVIFDKLIQEKMLEDVFNPRINETYQFVSGSELNMNTIMDGSQHITQSCTLRKPKRFWNERLG